MLKFSALALGVVLFAGTAVAEEQVFDPMPNGQIGFVMPSGNIGCLYTPEGGTDVYQPASGGAELICERVEPSYVTVVLAEEGAAEVIANPGEQSCCGAENVFAYGNEVEIGGFFCESRTTGLACENGDGYGFTMARASVEAFELPDEESDDTDAEDED